MRQENFISGNELAVQMNDFAEIYFFEKDKEQVFIKFGGVKELYADSFFHFIVKKTCGTF